MGDATKSAAPRNSAAPASAGRQERSRATRSELIDAARRIFARDGFELARLEDIAAAAGKTRGAFYAHFQDKEDVFFAIFEVDLAKDEQRIRRALAGARSLRERIDALTVLLAKLVKDRRRMLLSLEFKLYAIRRPHRQKRLAELHAAMCLCCAERKIDELLPELKHKTAAKQRKQAAHFASLLDGLALNRLFDPLAVNEKQLRLLIQAGVQIAVDQVREP